MVTENRYFVLENITNRMNYTIYRQNNPKRYAGKLLTGPKVRCIVPSISDSFLLGDSYMLSWLGNEPRQLLFVLLFQPMIQKRMECRYFGKQILRKQYKKRCHFISGL